MTPKQERFVQEYLIDLNATQAAIRAGYSPNGAEVTASKLLRIAKVAAAVAKAQQERAVRTELTQDWVLEKLRGVAERTVASATFEAAGANRSLELLGKHLGMFTEKSDITLTQRYVVRAPEVAKDADEWQQKHSPLIQ